MIPPKFCRLLSLSIAFTAPFIIGGGKRWSQGRGKGTIKLQPLSIRVDMSKALHFAYTSHGKSLTITLLTYTLTRSKRNFFFFYEEARKHWCILENHYGH